MTEELMKERIKELEEINEQHRQLNGELQQENKELKEKYLNAVSDYEQEKSKNQRAIEYIENEKRSLPLGWNEFSCEMVYSDEVVLVEKLLEILKGE